MGRDSGMASFKCRGIEVRSLVNTPLVYRNADCAKHACDAAAINIDHWLGWS